MLLLSLTALAADTVMVEVAGVDAPVEARATWLGEPRRVVLTDDNGDGVLTGTIEGDELRLLPMSLWVGDGRSALVGWQGIVPLGMGEQTITFTTLKQDPPTLQQASAPTSPDNIALREALMLAGWFGWLLLLLLGIRWVTTRREPVEQTDWRWWWSLPIWAGLAVAWTWPAVNAGGGAMVGRHFDMLGTIWAMDAAGRLLDGGLHDTLTAWPIGRDARRFDSFTLLPVGVFFSDLGLDRVHGALQVIGVFALGFFGERFSRAVGAKGWWGLVGGATLALSGLSANVLLEGHVYHILNPWLPLLGLTWWRATGPESRWLWGAASGLMFGLCLLTTAYMGMAATILVVGFALPALRRRSTWPALGAAAVVAALISIPYVWLFIEGNSGNRGQGDIQSALDLAAMAPITPELIRLGFARSLAPSAAVLALIVAALAVATPFPRRRTLAATAVVALLLSAGALPAELVPPTLLRFPVRLGWAFLLCAGALAALGGTLLEARHGRMVRLLALLAVIEPFAITWPGWSQTRQLSTTPAAYRAGTGPVIDLFPQDTDRGESLGVILSRMVCFYQTSHGRPIAEDCFEAPVREGPRLQIDPGLYETLLKGDTEKVKGNLTRLGFAGLAFHPDLFSDADRLWLIPRLSQIDATPTISNNGGERVMMYRLTPEVPHSTDLDFTHESEEDNENKENFVGDPLSGGEGTPRLRVELLVPKSYVGNGFWVTLTLDDGREWVVELYDDGRSPRDIPDDDLWVGVLDGPLPRSGKMELHLRGPQFSEVSWSGTAWLTEPLTELRFHLSVDHGKVYPMLASDPTSASPAITPYNDRVIVGGWLVWLLAAGLIGVRIRRTPVDQ